MAAGTDEPESEAFRDGQNVANVRPPRIIAAA